MIHLTHTFPGRNIISKGKSYLYFGGTSYLGLQTDSTFQEIYIKHLKKYGTNYGASRKSNVQISIFEDAENHLTNHVGSASCITVSSGYLAGQLLAQSLSSDEYNFFYAPESHSALHTATSKYYASYADLTSAVNAHLKDCKTTPVILMDSITHTKGGYPDFGGLQNIPLEKVILVIDDSHGIGIIGSNGCGAFKSAQKLNAKEIIVCCSLGKGYAIQAGAIFGKKNRIEHLKSTEFFGGASPATPAALATLVHAELLYSQKRNLLNENILYFLKNLKNTNLLSYKENYPAFYFSDPKISKLLEKNNILITNFNYPNQNSPLMSRIVLSAGHTKKDILFLTKLLNSI